MPHQEVLLHVPGDREAVIKFMKEKGIEHQEIFGRIWIKNCLISLDEYGDFGNALRFETDSAKKYENHQVAETTTPGNLGYGDRYLPFKDQQRIFNQLKRTIMAHRTKFYKETEENLNFKKGERSQSLQELKSVIDFEKNVLSEEHKLEEKIRKTIDFIESLESDFPASALAGMKVDAGILAFHVKELKNLIAYLQAAEIEAVHILKDSQQPIQVTKRRKQVKILKKRLQKLSVMLNAWVKQIKSFLNEIRQLQITTEMRKHLNDYYAQLLEIYTWYAELFRNEAKKK